MLVIDRFVKIIIRRERKSTIIQIKVSFAAGISIRPVCIKIDVKLTNLDAYSSIFTSTRKTVELRTHFSMNLTRPICKEKTTEKMTLAFFLGE